MNDILLVFNITHKKKFSFIKLIFILNMSYKVDMEIFDTQKRILLDEK